jgi:hypothetical protein
MENSKAIQILEALAKGIDPITAEVMPDNHCLQHPDIIRSLFLAIQAMKDNKSKVSKDGRVKDRRLNEGTKWTEEEDLQLKDAFQENSSISNLAKIHQRSYGAIKARLVKHGLIKLDSGDDQS